MKFEEKKTGKRESIIHIICINFKNRQNLKNGSKCAQLGGKIVKTEGKEIIYIKLRIWRKKRAWKEALEIQVIFFVLDVIT